MDKATKAKLEKLEAQNQAAKPVLELYSDADSIVWDSQNVDRCLLAQEALDKMGEKITIEYDPDKQPDIDLVVSQNGLIREVLGIYADPTSDIYVTPETDKHLPGSAALNHLDHTVDDHVESLK